MKLHVAMGKQESFTGFQFYFLLSSECQVAGGVCVSAAQGWVALGHGELAAIHAGPTPAASWHFLLRHLQVTLMEGSI